MKQISLVWIALFFVMATGCRTTSSVAYRTTGQIDTSATYKVLLLDYNSAALTNTTVQRLLIGSFVKAGIHTSSTSANTIECQCELASESRDYILVMASYYQALLKCTFKAPNSIVSLYAYSENKFYSRIFSSIGIAGYALTTPDEPAPYLLAGGVGIDLIASIANKSEGLYQSAIEGAVNSMIQDTVRLAN